MTDRVIVGHKAIARELGASERTVRRLYRDGKLRGSFRLSESKNSQVRIKAADLEQLKVRPAERG